MAVTQGADGIINPPIDELLEIVDSKYRLVILAAKRARQINAYYSQLGEGLLEYVGPLVETRVQEKPLLIALREAREGLLKVSRPRAEGDAPTPPSPAGNNGIGATPWRASSWALVPALNMEPMMSTL